MKRFFAALSFCFVFAGVLVGQDDVAKTPSGATAQNKWPMSITLSNADITIFQPQLETFKDNTLTARAAVSVKKKGDAKANYCAIWMKATADTDKDTRIVTLRDLTVTQVAIPNTSKKAKKFLGDVIRKQILKADLSISLDRLLAMMETIEKNKKKSAALQNNVPKFFFSKEPAVLVNIDGEPVSRDLGDGLSQIANTRFLILKESATKKYYLKCAGRWFTAAEIKGSWTPIDKVPKKIAAIGKKEDPSDEGDSKGDMPKIFVATRPAELIQSFGEPELAQIPGTDLSYLKNSDNDIFRDAKDQKLYLLVSGRWFTAAAKEGPWAYIASDKLPADFKKIPANSPKASVLASIAGTREAKDAVMESYIPQTATIKRGTVSLDIVYDGEPEFQPIEGTSMSYAVNTRTPVVKLNDKYYACDNGAWYESDSPKGKWDVCVKVPEDIYTIPPSCPIYNATFAKVYDSDDDSVDVGYTSGYDDSYDYGGTIVYGTGYYYRRWWRRRWLNRPVTYGNRFRYNNLDGRWNRYDRYRDRYGRYVAWNNRKNNYRYDRPARADGYYRGAAVGTAAAATLGHNAYRRNKGTIRTTNKAIGIRKNTPKRLKVASAKRATNNVYVGKDGKIYRHGLNGWQKRDNGKWSGAQTAKRALANKNRRTKPTIRTSTKRNSNRSAISAVQRKNLYNSYKARQRGNARVRRRSNYSRSRSRSRASRSRSNVRRSSGRRGGGHRGGGRRR